MRYHSLVSARVGRFLQDVPLILMGGDGTLHLSQAKDIPLAILEPG